MWLICLDLDETLFVLGQRDNDALSQYQMNSIGVQLFRETRAGDFVKRFQGEPMYPLYLKEHRLFFQGLANCLEYQKVFLMFITAGSYQEDYIKQVLCDFFASTKTAKKLIREAAFINRFNLLGPSGFDACEGAALFRQISDMKAELMLRKKAQLKADHKKPVHCYFIDDSPGNRRSAQRQGLKVIDPSSQGYTSELKSFLSCIKKREIYHPRAMADLSDSGSYSTLRDESPGESTVDLSNT